MIEPFTLRLRRDEREARELNPAPVQIPCEDGPKIDCPCGCGSLVFASGWGRCTLSILNRTPIGRS